MTIRYTELGAGVSALSARLRAGSEGIDIALEVGAIALGVRMTERDWLQRKGRAEKEEQAIVALPALFRVLDSLVGINCLTREQTRNLQAILGWYGEFWSTLGAFFAEGSPLRQGLEDAVRDYAQGSRVARFCPYYTEYLIPRESFASLRGSRLPVGPSDSRWRPLNLDADDLPWGTSRCRCGGNAFLLLDIHLEGPWDWASAYACVGQAGHPCAQILVDLRD